MESLSLREKKKFRFPFYIVKKMTMSKTAYWLLRAGGILLALLSAGIACTILKPGSFGLFYIELFRGTFDFTDISTIIDLFAEFAIMALIAICLTPAFKMKFWNIGAEGQILIGCLISAGIAKFMNGSTPNLVIILTCAACSIIGGIIWSIIPAIFKAFFNTNETLFTLMMNYIATIMVSLFISIWIKNGSQSFGVLSQGTFPRILGNTSTLVIGLAIVVYVVMFFYIKMSKQYYEVSVVGESLNTARYIGINVKKVILRTIIITGAIAGFIGFLITCGVERTLSPSIVNGRGFTGVLVAWLGHFDPTEILLFSFLTAFIDRGTVTAASSVNISSTQFSAICTGVFFFIIIACEFFTNYRIKRHPKENNEEKGDK